MTHKQKSTANYLIFAPLIILTLIFFLLPIYWMTVTSFKPNLEIFRYPPTWVPEAFTAEHYREVFETAALLKYFWNNIVVSLGVTGLSMVISAMAGYSLSRFRSAAGKAVHTGLLSTQMFPVVGILLSLYLSFRALHLLNTRLALILAISAMAVPYSTTLIKSFFDSIPFSLDESARIEGCSRLGVLGRIILPLAKPGLLSIGLFAFMQGWDDFTFAVTLITKDTVRTLSSGITMRFLGETSFDMGLVSAVSMMGSLPMFLLIVFFQRFLVKNLTAGAVKG